MAESAYLELKKTSLLFTGMIFSPLIAYAAFVTDQALLQALIITLVAVVSTIFVVFVREIRRLAKPSFR